MARRTSDRRPEPCEPGSIEQQLDMCETGPLKGDMVLGRRVEIAKDPDQAIEDENEMMLNYRVDMAETGREGDDSSGDEHSSGLQGGEPELETQSHIDSGTPGDRTDKEEDAVKKRNVA